MQPSVQNDLCLATPYFSQGGFVGKMSKGPDGYLQHKVELRHTGSFDDYASSPFKLIFFLSLFVG